MSRQQNRFRLLSRPFRRAECRGDAVAGGLVDRIITNGCGDASRQSSTREGQEVGEAVVVRPSGTNPRSIFGRDCDGNSVVLAFGAFGNKSNVRGRRGYCQATESEY